MQTRSRLHTKPADKAKKSSSGRSKCSRCGKGLHSSNKCPARDTVCHKCKKRGHYSSQCYGRSVDGIAASDHTDPDIAFLDTVSSNSNASWYSDVQLCGRKVRFKLDTGAEVTAISSKELEQLNGMTLEKPSKTLHGPNHQCLDVKSQFTTTMTHHGSRTRQPVFVVKGLTMNILGLPAIQALRIASKIDSISQPQIARKVNFATSRSYDTVIHNTFPKLFLFFCNVGEVYKISLKPNANHIP